MKRKSEDLNQVNPFYTPTDRQCIRHSHKPLWLVNDDELTYQSIVVAIDPISSDQAHKVLNEKIVLFSRWLAEKYDAKIKYVNVYEAPIQRLDLRWQQLLMMTYLIMLLSTIKKQ